MDNIKAYKLFTLRKDGSIGPLFINRRLRVPLKEWVQAEPHLTKGYKFRPGWHACPKMEAPHLSKKGRVWCRVTLQGVTEEHRPASQGGTWYLAERLRVDEILS